MAAPADDAGEGKPKAAQRQSGWLGHRPHIQKGTGPRVQGGDAISPITAAQIGAGARKSGDLFADVGLATQDVEENIGASIGDGASVCEQKNAVRTGVNRWRWSAAPRFRD